MIYPAAEKSIATPNNIRYCQNVIQNRLFQKKCFLGRTIKQTPVKQYEIYMFMKNNITCIFIFRRNNCIHSSKQKIIEYTTRSPKAILPKPNMILINNETV